jgi:arsenite methyltransferase
MHPSTAQFDGPAGRLAGAVMARTNRDMEIAAVDELGPAPDDAVVAVGFGPGVGIAALAPRLPDGLVAGIDPSASMVALASRRNRVAIAAGRVELVQARVESIPWRESTFAGVLAVNSMQLWEPLDVALDEVARVLIPGGTLVTVTHRWAIERRAPLDEWVAAADALLGDRGFKRVAHRTGRFRSGTGLVMRAQMS